MISSGTVRTSGLVNILTTCLISASALTGCKSYIRTEREDGKITKTITLPVNKGTYTGLFHKPIIYGGMDGDGTFYIYPSYDNHAVSIFSASSNNIIYYGDRYDVIKVQPDTLILRQIKNNR